MAKMFQVDEQLVTGMYIIMAKNGVTLDEAGNEIPAYAGRLSFKVGRSKDVYFYMAILEDDCKIWFEERKIDELFKGWYQDIIKTTIYEQYKIRLELGWDFE